LSGAPADAGTNSVGVQSEGAAEFLPPNPFLFARPSVQFGARLPAEASAQAAGEARCQFCSKKVQISSNKRAKN